MLALYGSYVQKHMTKGFIFDFDIDTVKFKEKKGAAGYSTLYFSVPYANYNYPNATAWISELAPDDDGLLRIYSWFDIFLKEDL